MTLARVAPTSHASKRPPNRRPPDLLRVSFAYSAIAARVDATGDFPT
jgi:hypothetical protein